MRQLDYHCICSGIHDIRCRISRIDTVDTAIFLSNLDENVALTMHCWKVVFLGYISVADNVGLTSTIVTQLPPKLLTSVK